MSLHISHRHGALLVSARSAARDDCIDQLVTVLPGLVAGTGRVVLDLSEVTLTPSKRISCFMEHVADLLRAGGCEVIVVAERLSARRVLRAAGGGDVVPVVGSVTVALGEPPEPRVPAQRSAPSVPARVRRPAHGLH